MKTGSIPIKRYLALGVSAVLLIVTLMSLGQIFERVDAGEIVIIQAPISGDLAFHVTAGLKLQAFGTVTTYPKRQIYTFENRMRFNEGGHGVMHGSIQWEMPQDVENLTSLHTNYRASEAIQQQLVQVVTDKATYLTGPLLSSKESYAEKRTNLISWVEDQILRGVYQTEQYDSTIIDPISNEPTTRSIVQITLGEDGLPLRRERAQLEVFGIRAFNFAVTQIVYDQTVEAQIQSQQENIMAVQTAIAEARRAEQKTITVAAEGEALATEAQWKQEVIKAQQVTEAQQRLEVAVLDRQAAVQERQANILRGQGEGERRRLVMVADGALKQKLDALIEINANYATAIQTYKGAWVPTIVMGGDNGVASVAGSGAQQLIQMLLAKTAQDLAVDFRATGDNGGN